MLPYGNGAFMRDDSILDLMSEAETSEDAMRLFFYHGSLEVLEGDPREGGDGLFWCAPTPAIAQCYIPAAGSECFLAMSGYQLRERVQPSQFNDWYGLVKAMGLESPDVEWGPDGTAKSWVIPDGYPTYGDVCDWIEGHLGYGNVSTYPNDRQYRIKTSYLSGNDSIYLPASHKSQGSLLVVNGLKELRFLDMATGREGNLQDPAHNRYDWFERAAAEGCNKLNNRVS